MGTAAEPQGKAMYVAPRTDWSWLLIEQKKLYRRSWEIPEYVFRKLWGLVTDLRNLRVSLARIARNKGRRTAGVDGVTVRKVLSEEGAEQYLVSLRAELRSGTYRPSPVRRVLIPKNGQPGKFRPLGIPTVKDRVVQAALKNILEPIFEADFFPTSYGFRSGRSPHGALEHLRLLLRPKVARTRDGAELRLPYQWAIEGDIKGCFDHISHHGLMVRFRQRIGDLKVCRLVLGFLKAGVLSEEHILRTDSGAPQGGVLSPLLSNIALSMIEERYERHVWPRHTPSSLANPQAIRTRAVTMRRYDKRHGRPVFVPIRYADDFIILVAAPLGPDIDARARGIALQEKEELAEYLRGTMGLELSETKTLVTPVTSRLRFLGHHVCVRPHPGHRRMVSTSVIPRDRSQRLRHIIKDLFRRRTIGCSLADRLKKLNPLLRGWGYFYRHAWGAKKVFSKLDHYVWWTIFRWLRKKHPRTSMKKLFRKYARRMPGKRSTNWHAGDMTPYSLSSLPVERYQLGWARPPIFVSEPAH